MILFAGIGGRLGGRRPSTAMGVAMRKYVTEFIGTFGLVFTVGCAVLGNSPVAPIAIGAVLMVLIYAGGHISGGHYNPSVTLGVFLRGALPAGEVLPYWAAQLAAAFLAGWLARFVINPVAVHTISTSGAHAIVAVLLAEFLFTFALVYVVLNVATSKDQPGNQFFGLAIGFTVMAGAAAVGGISGGAFNPAVMFGAMLMGLIDWSNFWIYLLAQGLAALLAAVAFRYLNPGDVEGGPVPALPKARLPRLVRPAKPTGTPSA